MRLAEINGFYAEIGVSAGQFLWPTVVYVGGWIAVALIRGWTARSLAKQYHCLGPHRIKVGKDIEVEVKVDEMDRNQVPNLEQNECPKIAHE